MFKQANDSCKGTRHARKHEKIREKGGTLLTPGVFRPVRRPSWCSCGPRRSPEDRLRTPRSCWGLGPAASPPRRQQRASRRLTTRSSPDPPFVRNRLLQQRQSTGPLVERAASKEAQMSPPGESGGACLECCREEPLADGLHAVLVGDHRLEEVAQPPRVQHRHHRRPAQRTRHRTRHARSAQCLRHKPQRGLSPYSHRPSHF